MSAQVVGSDTATLAIDLGTTTGWALRTADGRIVSGAQSFKPGRFEGGGMRYLRFRGWLAEVLTNAGGIGAVYFEEVRRHAGVDAAHAYGGFLATLTALCEHNAIPYSGVPVGTIKKHATGKGNADKAAMVAAMRVLGFDPADDNEADALALLGWACAHGPPAVATNHSATNGPQLHPGTTTTTNDEDSPNVTHHIQPARG